MYCLNDLRFDNLFRKKSKLASGELLLKMRVWQFENYLPFHFDNVITSMKDKDDYLWISLHVSNVMISLYRQRPNLINLQEKVMPRGKLPYKIAKPIKYQHVKCLLVLIFFDLVI